MTQPLVLMVLDGWGVSRGGPRDAIAAARTPHWDRLLSTCPTTTLSASGEDVGLPEGQIGNSEVGHLNLGAGRVVYQELTRVNREIREGRFDSHPVLAGAAEAARAASGRVHLLGLLSDGGVHSHQGQILAAARRLRSLGLPVLLHAFMDGRDTPPRSGLGYARWMEGELAAVGARVATVTGRFFAMDRDNRWERVERAWKALVLGEGERAGSAVAAMEAAYARGENDEFVVPTVVDPEGTLRDGDAVLFMNFRADRAREISRALALPDFDAFPRPVLPRLSAYATLTEYDKTFPFPVMYPPEELTGILGEVVSGRGIPQLRIAETEKYAHVTFFFNGGVERSYPGEERVLVPSPRDVATYDQKPEMSAGEVADRLVGLLEEDRLGFVLVNFANPDMVGHTGVMAAAVRAIEFLDGCIGRVAAAVERKGGILLVTADHGNAECMAEEDGSPHTAHTTNRVPLILAGGPSGARLREGRLADVAPTVLRLMGIPQPPQMTGACLLES